MPRNINAPKSSGNLRAKRALMNPWQKKIRSGGYRAVGAKLKFTGCCGKKGKKK